MSALLHTHPPPNKNKLTIRAKNDEDLRKVAAYIKKHDTAYNPQVRRDSGVVQILFKPAPDEVIRKIIELDIENICRDAEITITWEEADYEDTYP